MKTILDPNTYTSFRGSNDWIESFNYIQLEYKYAVSYTQVSVRYAVT